VRRGARVGETPQVHRLVATALLAGHCLLETPNSTCFMAQMISVLMNFDCRTRLLPADLIPKKWSTERDNP
jgi:hypothetical protein